MPTCLSCGANLSPEWKYCIYCGAIAATVSPKRRRERADEGGFGLTIPPAIRPDVVDAARATRLDIPLLVGVVLGLAGTALIVYLAILLFGPK